MNIDTFPGLWFTQIDLPLGKIREFLATDYTTRGYALEYDKLEVDKFYLDELHEKPSVDFLAAIFYVPLVAPEKTIVLGNSGSWGTLSNYICKSLSCRNWQFDINDENSTTARNTLMVNDSGKSIRFVQTMFSDEDDNEWIFTAKGEPQWFETMEYYERKEIKLRLNKDILVEYCEKLQLPVREDDFFRTDSACVFVKHETTKRVKS
jgi:hypothetical protein